MSTVDTRTFTKQILDSLLEDIAQDSEGCCPFCFAEDFPVKGNLSGYEEVNSDEAEEWQLEHCPECLVLDIEKALSKCK